MREIFRQERERTLGNDWVVRHENHFYQVEAQSRSHAPAQSKVRVCEWADGVMEIRYRERKLNWHELAQRRVKPEVAVRNHPGRARQRRRTCRIIRGAEAIRTCRRWARGRRQCLRYEVAT